MLRYLVSSIILLRPGQFSSYLLPPNYQSFHSLLPSQIPNNSTMSGKYGLPHPSPHPIQPSPGIHAYHNLLDLLTTSVKAFCPYAYNHGLMNPSVGFPAAVNASFTSVKIPLAAGFEALVPSTWTTLPFHSRVDLADRCDIRIHAAGFVVKTIVLAVQTQNVRLNDLLPRSHGEVIREARTGREGSLKARIMR
jgi:hypothetical protein